MPPASWRGITKVISSRSIWFVHRDCGVAGAVCMVDYHALARWSLVAYGIAIFALVAVIIPGIGISMRQRRAALD